jgi:ATP-dependent Clp protease ATP-binding subunit ClpB
MRLDKFTLKAQEAIQDSQGIARRRNHQSIEPEHLAVALLDQKEGIAIPLLNKVGAHVNLLRSRVDDALGKLPGIEGGEGYLSQRLLKVFDKAEDEAKALKDEYVSTEHLLIALAEDKGEAGEALRSLGATKDKLRAALKDVRGGTRVTSQEAESQYRALEKYAKDLTALARAGKLDPVIGRDEEIRRVMQVLSRRTKNNPVLIGEPGVGKTAIVEGLASASAGDVPDVKDKRLALDWARSSPAQVPREFEDASRGLKEFPRAKGAVILFIDDLHPIVGPAPRVGDGRRQQLSGGGPAELHFICATPSTNRKRIEKDPA